MKTQEFGRNRIPFRSSSYKNSLKRHDYFKNAPNRPAIASNGRWRLDVYLCKRWRNGGSSDLTPVSRPPRRALQTGKSATTQRPRNYILWPEWGSPLDETNLPDSLATGPSAVVTKDFRPVGRA